MAEKVLADSEVLEILYNSYESFTDGSSDSVSSSDNEIDNIAVADAIVSDDSGDEEEVLHQDFRWEILDNYTGHREVFSCGFGPRNGAENISDVVHCFELFFDKEIIQQIVRETNGYAEQYKNVQGNLFPFRSLVRLWTPVTESEIYTVLGLFLLLGIVQKPTARSYFSKRRLITPGFADVISRERFELICKFLHFVDNESLLTYRGPPKLFKIYPVICHLNIKFQTLYLPNQNIAIDGSLTLWKGCLSIRQYLPLKASKFGIKTFELCESRTGYLWCFLVYTGKNMVLKLSLIAPDTPKTATVVLELLEPLFGCGHTLWIDNFSSPELGRKLKIKHSTDCVGTLKLNRKNVPKEVKDKLEKGEIIA